MAARETLHRLVDELSEAELSVAERFLEYLRNYRDPVLHAFLSAPEDDEPLSPEDAGASDEAWRAYTEGRDSGEPLDKFRERAE